MGGLPLEHPSAPADAVPVLDSVARSAAAALDVRELAQILVARASGLVEAPAVALAGVEAEHVHLLGVQGLPAQVLSLYPVPVSVDDVLANVARTGERVELATAGASGAHTTAVWGGIRFGAIVAVPVTHRGDVVGVLVAARYEDRSFDEAHVARLELVAALTADALDRLSVMDLNPRHERLLALERRHTMVPALLSSVSEGLGGDLAMLLVADAPTDTVTPVWIHEPNPAAQVFVDAVQGLPQPAAGGPCETVLRTKAPVFQPQLSPALEPEEGSAPAWVEYLARFPTRGLLRVPVIVDDEVVAILGTNRRQPVPYTSADLDFLQGSARRLAAVWKQTIVLPPVAADGSAEAAPQAEPPLLDVTGSELGGIDATGGRGLVSRAWVDIAIGAVVPALVGGTIALFDTSSQLRPATALLAVVVAMAAWRGFRTALTSAIVGTLLVWYVFTDPAYSFAITTLPSALGIVVFVAAASLVLLLVSELRRAQNEERLLRGLVETLLGEAPVGLAFFDRDLRFRLVNRHLAAINGLSRAAHHGRRPSELSPAAAELYEPLLEQVMRTRRPVLARELSVEASPEGPERHWRVNYYPVTVADALIGVGATVLDITADTVARRRSEQLLRLAGLVAGAFTLEELTASVASFIRDTFAARATIGIEQGDGLGIVVSRGYLPGTQPWPEGATLPLSASTPLTEVVRTGATVVASSADDVAGYRDLPVSPSGHADAALLVVPIVDPSRPERTLGALQVSWGEPHELGAAAQVLLATAVSMMEAALSRIELREQLATDRFRAALDSMLDDVATARAMRDDDGRIVDFEIDYVNERSADGAGRSAHDLVGRRVTEVYPGWVESGMFDRFVAVVETGEPYTDERLHYRDRMPDGSEVDGFWSIRVTRLGDGYLAASRDVTAAVHAERAAREIQRLAERERTAVELLQQAALPVVMPDLPGITLGAIYQPATQHQPIGGDWYDVFALDDRVAAFLIADVAGHGPQAASFMVQIRNVVRALALEHREPALVLRQVNAVARSLNVPGGPFVTCCYATIDLDEGMLAWSQAGHFAPLVVRDGRAHQPETASGPPLAVFDDCAYVTERMPLVEGDRIVVFTDGLVERRDEFIDEGLERLAHRAEELDAAGPQEAAEGLLTIVGLQVDDLAVLCVDIDRPATR